MIKKLLPLILLILLFSFSGNEVNAQATPWSFLKNTANSNSLDVYFTTASPPLLRLDTAGYLYSKILVDSDNNAFKLDPNATSTLYQINTSWINNGSNITNSGQLTNTGNVGIGTTTPTAQLEIQRWIGGLQGGPTIRLTRDSTGGSAIYHGTNAGTELLIFGVRGGGSNLAEAAGYERMVLTSAGNVGIGLTAPTQRLDVAGGIKSSSGVIFVDRTTASNLFQWYGQDNIARLWSNTAPGGDIMSASGVNGNVGIGTGTIAPAAKLEVKQSSDVAGGGLRLTRTGASTGYANIVMASDNGLWFYVNSGTTYYCVIGATGGWGCNSDKRLKENITPIGENALDIITQLKPSTYNFISDPMKKLSAGFIAQDVLGLIPDAVERSPETGYYTLSYDRITPYLTKGIQQLNQKSLDQQAQIEELKKEIDQLKNP